MRKDQLKIIQAALERFGPDTQLRVLQEECSECAAAVSRVFRSSRPNALPQLIEEIADVAIVLEAARIAVGQEDVEEVIERKLARLQDRINDPTYCDMPSEKKELAKAREGVEAALGFLKPLVETPALLQELVDRLEASK